MSLNKTLPLAHQGPQLVGREVHTLKATERMRKRLVFSLSLVARPQQQYTVSSSPLSNLLCLQSTSQSRPTKSSIVQQPLQPICFKHTKDHATTVLGQWCPYPEVGQDILPLNIFGPQLNLAESLILILLQVCQGDLEHSTLQSVGGDLSTRHTLLITRHTQRRTIPSQTESNHIVENKTRTEHRRKKTKPAAHLSSLRPRHKGLAQRPLVECVGHLDVIPFFLGEGVDNLLLAALLSLGDALVLADRHGCKVQRPSPQWAREDEEREEQTRCVSSCQTPNPNPSKP